MTRLIRITAVILGLLFASTCQACIVAGVVGPTFFNAAPKNIDAAIIAEVTITEIVSPPDRPYTAGPHVRYGFYVATGRIERLFKGQLDKDTIRIIAPGSSCNDELQGGMRGIVAGNLEVDNQTGIALVLTSGTDAGTK